MFVVHLKGKGKQVKNKWHKLQFKLRLPNTEPFLVLGNF
jgi:hypothetical protein